MLPGGEDRPAKGHAHQARLGITARRLVIVKMMLIVMVLLVLASVKMDSLDLYANSPARIMRNALRTADAKIMAVVMKTRVVNVLLVGEEKYVLIDVNRAHGVRIVRTIVSVLMVLAVTMLQESANVNLDLRGKSVQIPAQ